MDLLIGVFTVLLGLCFVATPWAVRLAGDALASTTIIAGGVVVTLLGLALAWRAPSAWRTGRPRR